MENLDLRSCREFYRVRGSHAFVEPSGRLAFPGGNPSLESFHGQDVHAKMGFPVKRELLHNARGEA